MILSGLPTSCPSPCSPAHPGNKQSTQVENLGNWIQNWAPLPRQPEYEQHTKDCPRSRSNSGYAGGGGGGVASQQPSYPLFSPPLLMHNMHPHPGILSPPCFTLSVYMYREAANMLKPSLWCCAGLCFAGFLGKCFLTLSLASLWLHQLCGTYLCIFMSAPSIQSNHALNIT